MHTTYSSRKRKNHNLSVFFITLGSVLLAGTTAIFVLAYPKHARKAVDEEVLSLLKAETFTDDDPALAKKALEEEAVLGANVNKEKYYDILRDPELMRANNIYSRNAVSPDYVTIGFTGDILFDDEYAVTATLKQRGGAISSGISQDALDLMKAMDIMVVNNEFPYTNRGTPTFEKQFTFRADPSTVSYLKEMGADVAILANNHVYDFGETGLNDTLDTLNGAGIVPIGAGHNLTEASRPAYFIVNDIKIAIIASTQIERNDHPNTIGATDEHGGTFRCWTGDLIYQKIAEAKANADFVIVCMHWGTEKESSPDHYQTNMAPLLANAGADLIIGDHPHVLQGITYFGNTPCIYSLGNFWFNSSTLDSGMIQVAISKDGLSGIRFVPAVQTDCRTSLVYGADSKRVLDHLRSLSPGVVIDESGMITKK